MRARSFLMPLLSAVALLAPLPAVAQQAQTSTWVNMRAGPAPEYPIVVQLPPATFVLVQGCIANYSWCDVVAYGDLRGWVYSANLLYLYQGQTVPIITYGPTIGLPIVAFILGAYWADHYRHHGWYSDWRRWDSWGRNPPAHRPPPPPHRPDYRPPGRPPPGARPPGHPPRPPSATPPRPPIRPPGAQPPTGPRPPAGRPPSGRPPSSQPPPGRPPSGQPPSGQPPRPSGPPPSAGQLPAGTRPPAGRPPSQGGQR